VVKGMAKGAIKGFATGDQRGNNGCNGENVVRITGIGGRCNGMAMAMETPKRAAKRMIK